MPSDAPMFVNPVLKGFRLRVMRPSRVGDGGFRVVAQLCLLGAGGQGAGDLVPGVPVDAGAAGEVGQAAFGLAGEAGREGDGGQVVAGPGAAAPSELGERVADQVVLYGPGMVMAVSGR
jgi:hypothetical protein